jgi:SWI/SNF-related matrix-associated actin-dependent regulator of chromatin subfamily A member 5
VCSIDDFIRVCKVRVFRLITEHTVEELIVERAEMKLRLNHVLIRQGRTNESTLTLNSNEILSMIRHGVRHVFASEANDEQLNIDIDQVLIDGQRRRDEQRQISNDEKTLLRQSIYDFEGEDYRNRSMVTMFEPMEIVCSSCFMRTC